MSIDTKQQRPEILAPAGNEEMMRAAVENGADAVYFGLQQFNARLRAANFSVTDLPRLMAWLHERGIRGYVTMNTLVFPAELEEAAETLRACSEAGVDAVLVQDLGLALLASRLVPDLPVHASTQMTVTSAEAANALDALGLNIERIVAARELSRSDLRKMHAATEKEIEVFVHGAICVAYSGQCLTSEALGGRSANRGECAQACRLPYDLLVDGEQHDLADVRYLLSPKDLAAHEDIGDLLRMGIVSLKIEGRLKSPQYVAATVQSYREAVRQAMEEGIVHLDEEHQRKLAMTFSRGFTGGYLHENDHQAVVEGRFPKKRGLFLGRVKRVQRAGVLVELEGPLRPGDGIVFDSGRPDEDEEGGRVYEMFAGRERLEGWEPNGTKSQTVELRFARDRMNFARIHEGDRVWKTSDPRLDAALAASYAPEKIHHQRPVWARVEGRIGAPLLLELRDERGITARVQDTAPADQALKRPLTQEVLEQQIGRLGNTPLFLAELDAKLDGDLMVPMSRLNELRRQAVEALLEARRTAHEGRRYDESARELLREPKTSSASDEPITPQLSVLCRTLEQVELAASVPGVAAIYTDFEHPRQHEAARKLVPASGPRFIPSTLRVIKPGEGPFVRALLKSDPDAILVRGLAAWEILRSEAPEIPLVADYSMNVANQITARLLMERGFRMLTPSYDLNINQLLDVLNAAPPEWFEVTIHQYMPLFHMEHCVFCRFLSEGTNYTDCGRPCESHTVALRDRMGFEHLLKADAGCRNTVFNAVAQSASAYMQQILQAGVRRFRIDFLAEDAERTREVIEAYLPVVRGEQQGNDLWQRLRVHSKLGVTKGSLDHE